MGMLDRYKKKGGFIQLIVLIETSTKQKQDQFLNLIAQENPRWEEAIRKKTLSIEKILAWDPIYLTEIFSRIQPLTMAVVLRSFSAEYVDKVLNCFTQSEKRKIQNIISETNPSQSEITTCVMKIITEVRELMRLGVLKLEKIDPEMMIPENIEEQLQNAGSSLDQVGVTGGFKQNNTAPAAKHNVGTPSGEVKAEVESSSKVEPVVELNFHTDDEPKSKMKTLTETSSKSSPKSKISGIAPGGSDVLKEENESLKRKTQQLLAENQQLKTELASLRNKLEQIRKIA